MDNIKKIAVGVTTTGIMLVSALPIFAAKPAVQACFGNDLAGYAQNGETDPGSFFAFSSGNGWGGFISGVARSPGADQQVGVGGEVNAHQAGSIPDAVISNSCNN